MKPLLLIVLTVLIREFNVVNLFKIGTFLTMSLLLVGCKDSHENVAKVIEKTVVTEIVIYNTQAGVQRKNHIKHAEAISPILAKQDGFISRQFSQSSNGKWVDIVYWKNLASAEKAAEQVQHISECTLFFSDMDPKSIEFMHTQTLFVYPQDVLA